MGQAIVQKDGLTNNKKSNAEISCMATYDFRSEETSSTHFIKLN